MPTTTAVISCFYRPKRKKMSLPHEISLEPKENIYFNAPYDVHVQNTNIRLKNTGDKKVGWAFKSTNVKRFSVTPTSGTLCPGEKKVLDVDCETFSEEPTTKDRMTIEWVNAPPGSDSCTKEWFQKSSCVRRQVIQVHYNI